MSESNAVAIRSEPIIRLVPEAIRVERIHDRINLEYMVPLTAADSQTSTYVRMRFHPESNVMWIRYIHVAFPLRSQGLGGLLVKAAEEVAYELDAHSINLYPLTQARSFWIRSGYGEHPHIARALTKQIKSKNSMTRSLFHLWKGEKE